METYLNIALIVLAITLILAILLQAQGGTIGGIFGGPSSVFRTKRGISRTLFQLTIILVVLFITISLLMLRMT